MIRQVKDYITDKTFHFKYKEDKINVVNYLEMLSLEENRIALKYEKGIFVIKGNNLKIQKLVEDEMLISGNIDTIELR